MRAAAVAVVAGVALIAACTNNNGDSGSGGGNSERITRSGFESDSLVWPFHPGEAIIRCEPGQVLVAVIEGQPWAINGAAQAAGYDSVVEVQVVDPSVPGGQVRLSVGDVIDAAQQLC